MYAKSVITALSHEPDIVSDTVPDFLAVAEQVFSQWEKTYQKSSLVGYDLVTQQFDNAPWAPSQYKYRLYWYRDSYHNDETVFRPSYSYNENPDTVKTASLYLDSPQMLYL